MRQLFLVLLLVVAVGGAGCSDNDDDDAGIANPASVFCEEQGGSLEIRTDDAGAAGYCVFEDGSECEEWAYFRGECAPGDNPGE